MSDPPDEAVSTVPSEPSEADAGGSGTDGQNEVESLLAEVLAEPVGAPARSVADTVDMGKQLRFRCKKSKGPEMPSFFPKMAAPSIKKSKSRSKRKGKSPGTSTVGSRKSEAERLAEQRHYRCLKRNRTVMSERMQQLSKPTTRYILNMWREHYCRLQPDAIDRFKRVLETNRGLDATEAYDYFVAAKKRGYVHKCKNTKASAEEKETLDKKMKKLSFNRKACVLFAHNVAKLFTTAETYHLSGSMLRLSDVILEDIACLLNTTSPPRCRKDRSARMLVDTADKIAVWVDQVLVDSEDRLLQMEEEDRLDDLYAKSLGTVESEESVTSKKSKHSKKSKESKESKETKGSNITLKESKTSKETETIDTTVTKKSSNISKDKNPDSAVPEEGPS